MAYTESNESVNAILSARYAQVTQYLHAVADQAEAQRQSTWLPTPGMSLEDYRPTQQRLREQLHAMLGYPPPGIALAAEPQISEIGQDEDGVFYRVTLPVLAEGFSAYGLFIQPHQRTRDTLVVSIHGGGGTPELAAGILGNSYNYNDMGRRWARRGHPVWMPMCFERLTMETVDNAPDLHRILDQRARMVGSTVTAIDLYAIIRGMEALLAWTGLERAIASGLSYGGFRSLLLAALSDAVVACVSSCYVNDRRAVLEQRLECADMQDWYFRDVLRSVTDVELGALICPRPLCVEVGASDELFTLAGAEKEIAEIQDVYATLGMANRFFGDVFDGGHEYSGKQAVVFLEALGL